MMLILVTYGVLKIETMYIKYLAHTKNIVNVTLLKVVLTVINVYTHVYIQSEHKIQNKFQNKVTQFTEFFATRTKLTG